MAIAKIFETLEFGKIQDKVRNYIQTEAAVRKVDQMRPIRRLNLLEYRQEETAQALDIINHEEQMPIPVLTNIYQSLKRLSLGADLNGKEIAEIYKLLISLKQIIDFFERLSEEEEKDYPMLMHWVDQAIPLPQLVSAIKRTIDENGNVLTSASHELSSIRRRQNQTEQQVRDQLNTMLKSRANQLSDSLITIRNDRYVLPVKAEYRYQFGGTVHDQSSTGQTLYIEPEAVMQLNNRRNQLQIDERREIERILQALSGELMPYSHELDQNQEIVSQLDFIQARALYAKEIGASKPTFSMKNHVAIWQARHPLIDPDEIVPNDIIIGENYRQLLITGPNTGGKTILLKTLGLIQLMGQSGLHIPAEAGSQIGVFDKVFADIGDEQSIEQSLSTFSSHMTNIIDILNKMTRHSLVLFDELGSGTDPQEGAALAMAILNYTRKTKATVMATTHYPELKVFAHETPDTINASMEFDSETLSPTYRLLIGIPGRSNAIEISKRLGLKEEILKEAQEGISKEDQSLNELVANLERERRTVEANNLKAEEELKAVEQLHEDLRREYNRWLEHKHDIEEKAKQEANLKVQSAQEEAEKLIQEIRDLQLEQGQSKTIKEHVLIEKKSSFNELKQPEHLRKNKVLRRAKKKRELKAGDDVEVLSYGQRGTIIEKTGPEEYAVQMGILKMKIKSEDLEAIKKIEPVRQINVQREAGGKVATSLDIRGERYEEGIRRLNQYLDQALLSNHPMVTIIHGKGTGALREGVQKALRRHPQVSHFNYSAPNAGGDGSTEVYFK